MNLISENVDMFVHIFPKSLICKANFKIILPADKTSYRQTSFPNFPPHREHDNLKSRKFWSKVRFIFTKARC